MVWIGVSVGQDADLAKGNTAVLLNTAWLMTGTRPKLDPCRAVLGLVLEQSEELHLFPLELLNSSVCLATPVCHTDRRVSGQPAPGRGGRRKRESGGKSI